VFSFPQNLQNPQNFFSWGKHANRLLPGGKRLRAAARFSLDFFVVLTVLLVL